jgi:bifunctional non-homologous end joining protein LigD
MSRLPAASATLDGEGVACDANGMTDFELLRAALGRPKKREVFLYAFDLLELDGRDMRREPWSDRRWKLARLLRGAGQARWRGLTVGAIVEAATLAKRYGSVRSIVRALR